MVIDQQFHGYHLSTRFPLSLSSELASKCLRSDLSFWGIPQELHSVQRSSLFVAATDQAGAKLVLVGDPEQLQPINAGAAFRAIAGRIGYIELEAVRR
jgi:ATP-dependent exoDNAse (exonuclease V) alpha subunit